MNGGVEEGLSTGATGSSSCQLVSLMDELHFLSRRRKLKREAKEQRRVSEFKVLSPLSGSNVFVYFIFLSPPIVLLKAQQRQLLQREAS